MQGISRLTNADNLKRRDILLTGASLLGASLVPHKATAGLSQASDLIAEWTNATSFQGTIVLARDGVKYYSEAFGHSYLETGRAAAIDDVYGIASISKWLTSLAVLRLVEQGKLDLDKPITAWLSGYRPDTGARITLRRLMSNSSGLLEQFSPAAKLDPTLRKLDITTNEAVRRFASGDIVFEPGSKFDYVFANWIVVLAIVEAVSARPFDEAVRDLVTTPMGLNNTRAGKQAAVLAILVPSYTADTPPLRKAYDHSQFLAAAGGYFSTELRSRQFSPDL
jgi:D-alanyl-D-alanine carboxypeptidase